MYHLYLLVGRTWKFITTSNNYDELDAAGQRLGTHRIALHGFGPNSGKDHPA